MKLFNKQLTIKDLLDIDENRIDRSKSLKVRLDQVYYITDKPDRFNQLLNYFTNKPKEIYYEIHKYKIKSDSGNEYEIFIKLSPSFSYNKFLKNRIQVFCSCHDFKYRVAYDLSQLENVYVNKDITRHLGDALKIPPTAITSTNTCKHLYAVIIYFKNNIKKYNLLKSK
jgi:hypothetical protein